MGMENYSLSDIRAAVDGNDGWGGGMGGGWFAWIILFALFGGGGFGFGGRGNVATTEDLASGFNFNALQTKTNDILAAVNGVNQNLGNAICQLGYQELQNINALERQIADCCCTTQRAIDSVKFDMANYSAATNANTTAVGQKILDKLSGMELAQKDAIIANQGQRIAALEADARMCGVVRYPTAATYATFCNPFFGFGGFNGNCGCGCNNI